MLQYMSGPQFRYRFEAQEGRILPFEELAKFYAVIILPWSPEICMLRHLFKMHVPLFAPDRNLLRNLVHVSNQRLMPFSYSLPMPGSDREYVDKNHPYDPFVDTARWPADVRGME